MDKNLEDMSLDEFFKYLRDNTKEMEDLYKLKKQEKNSEKA